MEHDAQAKMLADYEKAKQEQRGGADMSRGGAGAWGLAGRSQRHGNRNQGSRGGQWGHQSQDDSTGEVNMQIRNFLEDFSTAVTEKRVENLEDMYTKEYPKYCDQLVRSKMTNGPKNNKWPTLDEARGFLGDSHNVHMLYKELYYRHIFARLDKQVTGEDRADAWNNYQKIFDQLGKDLQGQSDSSKSLLKALPISWMWDLLDEFLYQYLMYCGFKAKAVTKKVKGGNQAGQQDHDYVIVTENPNLFDPQEVFFTLKRLITQTNIDNYLKVHKGEASEVPQGTPVPDEQSRYLGYFAKVQQMRYHIMLGEYDKALITSHQLDFGCDNAMYYKNPACHVTLFYFVAFSLFMEGRFSDATDIISKTLYFISKLSRFPPLSDLYQLQTKTQEKMMRLLVLCDVYSPDNFYVQPEETVLQQCLDRYSEDIKILRTWGMKEKDNTESSTYAQKLVEFFNIISPRFVTILDQKQLELCAKQPTPEQMEEREEVAQSLNALEGHNRQWERFWMLIEEQRFVPMIRSYLRMYTKINVCKLTELCGFGDDQECMRHLQRVEKANMQLVIGNTKSAGQNVLNGGSNTVSAGNSATAWQLLPGYPQKCTDLEFAVDATGDINVKILRSPKNYSSIYVQEIHNLQNILKNITVAKA